MASMGTPAYDPNGTVREALGVYWQAYGLGNGGYDEPYHVIRLLWFVPVLIPNPPARKRALRRHDLNHVLGSYDAIGTSGEIDIAGFEIGAKGGCRGYGVAWGINLLFFAVGLVSRPRHLFRSFVRARGSLNAYSLETVEGVFWDRRLGEVRTELHIPEQVPDATLADGLSFVLWGLLAFSPVAILVGVIAALSDQI
jgi:hypothetical protein